MIDIPQINIYQLLSSNAVSGALSGFLIGTMLQPLEIIKLCLIVNPPQMAIAKSSNFAASFYLSARFVYKIEGLKGFWKGLSPALMRTGAANSVYFHFLEVFQSRYSNLPISHRLNDFMSSASARVFSTVLSNPLMVIKTRMELPGSQYNYRGVEDAIMKISKQEGAKTLFKGTTACVMRDVPFAGLYFTLLNFCKDKLTPIKLERPTKTMIAGILAGLVATAATHPFEVARTYLQVDRVNTVANEKGIGTIGILTNVAKQEGISGLFKGLQARLIRKPLSNALTFTLFETFKRVSGPEPRMI